MGAALSGGSPGAGDDGAKSVEAILSARSDLARSHRELLGDKIKDQLLTAARALSQIDNPVLKAKMAVIMLDQVAAQLGELRAPGLPTVWSPALRRECAEALQVLRAAHSLHSEVLQGFREREPEFTFRYLLYQGLFHGRLPVPSSDLKDTLATFTLQKKAAPSFRGVRDAIEGALKVGPFYIVTGDTHDTVVNQFLLPNRWVKSEGGAIVPAIPAAQNLIWLPRTGMEIVQYDRNARHFVRAPMVRGIQPSEVAPLRALLERTYAELKVKEHFAAPGRSYRHNPEWGPGSVEVRSGADGGDLSVSSFPAGILEKDARTLFKADSTNAPFLEAIVCCLNAELRKMGMAHIVAKRGGLSTIDLVTSDKGIALEHVKRSRLKPNEQLVFFGDRLALNGNDVEAINAAEISVQVGNEWDPMLLAPGSHVLLRSKDRAHEGASAEYIRFLTSIRRLGMSGILSAGEGESLRRVRGAVGASRFGSGRLARATSIGHAGVAQQLAKVRAARNALLAPDLSVTQRREASRALRWALDAVPETETVAKRSPLVALEIQLLKRVARGEKPVLASDLKDTVAAFDSERCRWLPRVKAHFLEALRSGPYFLMTGDSIHSVRSRFLLPSGILREVDGTLASELAGIRNLHLIARNGLDHATFEPSEGQLKRAALIPGIATKFLPPIRELLRRATEVHRCGTVFREFAHREGFPPGYVDVRGGEFGENAASCVYFPAGVLEGGERTRFRATSTTNTIVRMLASYVRRELQELGVDSVLVQQGASSTLDLTTSTKGTALAELRRRMLGNDEFLVYVGDSVTHHGNDGSTLGVADITVQVGAECDQSIAPPPGHYHTHAPSTAENGGTAAILAMVLRARRVAERGIWGGHK